MLVGGPELGDSRLSLLHVREAQLWVATRVPLDGGYRRGAVRVLEPPENEWGEARLYVLMQLHQDVRLCHSRDKIGPKYPRLKAFLKAFTVTDDK